MYSLEDKHNPAQSQAFREKLLEYLKISQEASECLQVWFGDERGFSLRGIIRKTWGQKGRRKKVTGQRRRGRVNMMGGLRYNDKKRISFVLEKGDADTFYREIKALHILLRKEWVETGKPEEFFQ